MIKFLKREKLFLLIFGLFAIVFLWDLFFLKKTFLFGDYKQQFFPWSIEYAKAVKHFTLPFWTNNMACGFPLVAEGQIGPFYPLNLMFFYVLPPISAYSYSIILHFILGGIFMYIFCKKMGLEDLSAVLPAILFMFASPYAGCFSNIASLKVLCWFPLMLYMILASFKDGRPIFLLFAGIVMGFQLLAGAPQMAFYSIVFSALYFVFFLFSSGKSRVSKSRYLLMMALAGIIALAIFSPQMAATRTLVSLSNRSARDLSFALARSFFPAGVLTLVFPSTMSIFDGMMYTGILPLIFGAFAAFHVKKNEHVNFFVALFLISLFCAFGRYNPLYVIFLKLTNFYLFRIPSKFLFFSAFSLIVLSGFGLRSILEGAVKEGRRKISILLWSIPALSIVFLLLTDLFLRMWKSNILIFVKSYVTEHVYNPALHKYPIKHYMDKVDNLYQNALDVIGFSDRYIIMQVTVLVVSVILLAIYNRQAIKRSLFGKLLVAVIFIDMMLFSFIGTGFRGNIVGIDDTVKKSEETEFLKNDNSLFRVYEFRINEEDDMLQPNLNMYFGVDNIGVYSPLIYKRYTELIGELGCVDDSTGFSLTSGETLHKKIGLLSMLNVKYVFSREDVGNEALKFLKNISNGKKIFLNNKVLPRAYIVHKAKVIRNEPEILNFLDSEEFNPGEMAVIENELQNVSIGSEPFTSADKADIVQYKDRIAIVRTRSESNGLLILSDYYYPGWKCYIDGKPTDILRANYILRAVYLPKGEHEVKFEINN